MSKRTLLIVAGLIVLGAGWLLFRPEKLFVNKTVSETLPTQAVTASNMPRVLLAGRFHGVAHETQGTATVYRLADGKRVLRFTDFETSNGPDVQVYLGMANDAKDNATVTTAGFFPLGPIKGNRGDQNYELPADLDLAKFHSVTVWCRRFGVNFATAPLNQASGTSNAMQATSSSSAPAVLLAGRFHGVAHESKGVATVYQLADGKRIIRLTEFETSNGPELQLYMVTAPDANDSDTVKKAGFVTLGPLKGNKGDQNYELPADLDLAKYHSVTVWCRRFGVNFATAPLAQQ